MLRIGLLTSGGDCQALNATMRGVVKGLANNVKDLEVYGFMNGYKGLIYSDYRMLSAKDFSGILTQGGTILGTSRQPFKLMRTPDANGLDKVEAMKHTYHKLLLDCLVILGGNGTQKTANLLREEGLNIIHLPKTIDNDLPVTDHTPGYGSAARYVASTVREIVLDASVYQQPAVTIVELMGRHAGWVTAASSLARKFPGDNPLLIYMPEAPFEMEEFFSDLENALKQSTAVVVCVSEGIRDASGKFICEYSNEAQLDTFGHKMLTGCGKLLESYVRNRFGVKVRSVELNVNQRCSSLLSSLTDINEADLAGRTAVKCALEGVTGKMITFKRADGEEYSLEYGLVDVCDVCNKEKPFPTEWITGNNNDISPEFANYALPLMRGVPEHVFEDGVPKYLYRK